MAGFRELDEVFIVVLQEVDKASVLDLEREVNDSVIAIHHSYMASKLGQILYVGHNLTDFLDQLLPLAFLLPFGRRAASGYNIASAKL